MVFDLSNYMTVPERINEFRAKHPEGSLQTEIVPLPEAMADTFIAVKAYAYRTPDDPRPGVGLAYEPFPGKTPYTKDSELQNAETSAWGRAIVAALASDTRKGIATQDEIRNRQEAEDIVVPAYRAATLRTDITSGDVTRMRPAELAQRLRDAGLEAGGTKKAMQDRLAGHLLSKSSPDVTNPAGETRPVGVTSDGEMLGMASSGPENGIVGLGPCASCGNQIPEEGELVPDGQLGVEDDSGRLHHADCLASA